MPIEELGMAGIAAGQSMLNQGLGMINQDRQAKLNKEQAKYQQGLNIVTGKQIGRAHV